MNTYAKIMIKSEQDEANIKGIKIIPSFYTAKDLDNLACSGRKYVAENLDAQTQRIEKALHKHGFSVVPHIHSDELPSGGKILVEKAWEGIPHDPDSAPPRIIWKEYTIKKEQAGEQNRYLAEHDLVFHGLNGERGLIKKVLEDSVVRKGPLELFTLKPY